MSEPARRDAVWTGRHPHASRDAINGEPVTRPASLRLVADSGRLVLDSGRLVADGGRQRAHASGARNAGQRQRVRPRPAPHTPVRLTRRGRVVVTAAVALAIGALSMALAGAAEATSHSGTPAIPGRGVTKVEIRAGESLWSVAEAYDPNADTRLVIAQILQMNSLNSDQVQPGQMLWVPRD